MYSRFIDHIRMDINSDNHGMIVWDNLSGNIMGKAFSIGGICSSLSLGCNFSFGINNQIGFDVAMHENSTITLAYTNNNYISVHTESYYWNDIFSCLTPIIRPRPSQTIISSSAYGLNNQLRIAAPHISATTNYLSNPVTVVNQNNYALVFSDIEIAGYFWDHNTGTLAGTVITQPIIGCAWNENPDVVYTNDIFTRESISRLYGVM